ncbi:MAG: Wzz/FepE/Etk N-terminal domain-containing protein [Campylobacterales bacterium]
MTDTSVRPVLDDEIDLRELVRTLLAHKIFILFFTAFTVVAAVAYVSLKTPTYSAVFDILPGYTMQAQSEEPLSFATLDEIAVYLGGRIAEIDRTVRIEKIALRRDSEMIEVEIRGESLDSVKRTSERLMREVEAEHQKILKQRLLPQRAASKAVESQIELYGRELHGLRARNAEIAGRTKGSEPALAALLLLERSRIEERVVAYGAKILELEAQKAALNNPLYVETKIAGFLAPDRPVAPKGRLIIAVAFVAGLMGSIFLVFFIEFIKGFKKEEKPAL